MSLKLREWILWTMLLLSVQTSNATTITKEQITDLLGFAWCSIVKSVTTWFSNEVPFAWRSIAEMLMELVGCGDDNKKEPKKPKKNK